MKIGDVLLILGCYKGVLIVFSEDILELIIIIFLDNEIFKIFVKMIKIVWYYVFVVVWKGIILWMIINGVEVFWGIVEVFYLVGESNSYFVVGK